MLNEVFKKNKQNPKTIVMKSLRLVAREVLFRVSMGFLYANQKEIRDSLTKNVNNFETDLVRESREKMEYLLKGMFPVAKKDKGLHHQFAQLERWLGHDLLTETIFMNSRARTSTELIFSAGIPRLQWLEYVNKQVDLGHELPEFEATFTTYLPSKRLKSTPEVSIDPEFVSQSKRSKRATHDLNDTEVTTEEVPEMSTGKLFGKSEFRCVTATDFLFVQSHCLI